MTLETSRRLFGVRNAFEHPVTLWATVIIAACLGASSLLILILGRTGRLSPETYDELLKRIRSWCVLAPILVVPILLGAAWVIAGVFLLSILCYREFARATGLFRNMMISLFVLLGIAAMTFAVADHWYGFFVALPALGVILIAAVGILADHPKGYIQRVALGGFGFLLFGVCFGHLGYIANDPDYRPILILLLVSVEMNDVFAYLSGKLLGKRKLAPNTSPNKTVGGALGALVLTTVLVATSGHFVFAGSAMGELPVLIGLGAIVSLAGQLGDLMLSSIKRDIGIKDMGATIPGHGGLLDRFDSLILVSPAFFHYVGYFRGFGLEEPARIFTGS